jgi:PleD family two-component response regulator
MLRKVAQFCGPARRANVWLRYGGEEFVVVAADLDIQAAQELRKPSGVQLKRWPYRMSFTSRRRCHHQHWCFCCNA